MTKGLIRKKAEVEDVGRLTDIRQSPDYVRFMEGLGWEGVEIGQTKILVNKIPFFGSLIRIPRANLPLPLEEIDRLAKQRRAAIVKIEPNLQLEKFNPKVIGGFVKDNHPVLPTRTIWIDLTQPIDSLWANLDKDSRNLVRRAHKEGVRVSELKDLGLFYKLWEETSKRKGFYVPFEKEMSKMWKAFGEKHLLVAKCGNKIGAAVLIFGYKEAAYYYFAASNEEGRKVYAGYSLMWEVIRQSKDWGYERLDLEGIRDEEVGRTKSWSGFSHFKSGFGGRKVQYAGSFSKYYSIVGRLIGRWV